MEVMEVFLLWLSVVLLLFILCGMSTLQDILEEIRDDARSYHARRETSDFHRKNQS